MRSPLRKKQRTQRTKPYRGKKKIRFRGKAKTTVEKVVKKAIAKSQDQKNAVQALPATSGFNKVQFGTNIVPGPTNIDRRIGDHVFLKGVRIEYSFENVSTATGNFAPELEFNVFVVQTKLDLDVEAKWFLDNNNEPQAFSAPTLASTKAMTRFNKQDIKIMHHFKRNMCPLSTNQQGPQIITGSYYVPIKKDIKWDDQGSTAPYAQNLVKPNIFVIFYYLAKQNFTFTTPVPGAYSEINARWYYRE